MSISFFSGERQHKKQFAYSTIGMQKGLRSLVVDIWNNGFFNNV